MTRRAWWLVWLNIVIPGSAQLVAGNRRLGRVGVSATFVAWGIMVAAAVIALVAKSAVVTFATNAILLTVVQVVLAFYAILWSVLTLDTLRLVKLVKTIPLARPLIAAFTVLMLALGAGTASYASVAAGVTRNAEASIFTGTTMLAPSHGRYNILVLGGDAGADREGLRPDSTSVASIDAVTGKTTLIGIPRNLERVKFAADSPLWAPFPKGYNCGDLCLIDYLYTYAEMHPKLYPKAVAQGSSPGIEAMMDAAEGVTGLKLQYYVLIDMKGFAELVDALGGVTVDVPERTALGGVTGKKPTGYLEQGKQVLSGNQALSFARSRYNTSDFVRMGHQRLIQEAMLKQFRPAVVLAKFQDIVKAGQQIVKTSIPTSALPGFVTLGDKARKLSVSRLELVPPEFEPAYPDYPKIQAAVRAAVKAPKAVVAP